LTKAVTAIERSPPGRLVPVGDLHRTDDAEFQTLASAPVNPTLKAKLKTAAANSKPNTVIDTREVIAKLGGNTEDNNEIAYDSEPDNEPRMRCPTVITSCCVPRDPYVTLHLTDVSDSQSVASHPVCPVRPLVV